MKNLELVTLEKAAPQIQEIFDALKKKIGMVPNLYATAANSPAALKGILAFGDSLRRGEFSKKEIEAVALAISQENGCEYCLAAHTAVGKMVGFSEDETLALRDGSIGDTKLNALTKLAKGITVTAGYPSQELIAGFFEVGYTKAALVELIGHVALNVFNNYLNHIADTPIDFPEAKKLIQKQSA